jgi:hypothetical protein
MDKHIYNSCYLPRLDEPCLMVLIELLQNGKKLSQNMRNNKYIRHNTIQVNDT